MFKFECCIECVAPKRHPACHSSCPEYIVKRAEYDRLKDKENHDNQVWQSIYAQKSDGVNRALKKHPR